MSKMDMGCSFVHAQWTLNS